jgi:starvation-inducible DNA-binding protein
MPPIRWKRPNLNLKLKTRRAPFLDRNGARFLWPATIDSDETSHPRLHLIHCAGNRQGRSIPEIPMAVPGTRSSPMPTQTHEKESQAQKLLVPDGFSPEEVKNLSSVLNALLADTFALYLKTKNFHWHMSGQHFRDYHLLLDEQATQIFDLTDVIAERVRKVGGTTVRSIGHIARLQRIRDNDEEFVGPVEMLKELHNDNKSLVESLRGAHVVASKANDYATTSLIEVWIDEAERRSWFLFEATR